MVSLYSLGVLLYITAYDEPNLEKKKRLQTLAKVIPRLPDPTLYIPEALVACSDFAQKENWKQLLKLTKGGHFHNSETNTLENIYETTMELCHWLRYCWKKTLAGTLTEDCLDVQDTKLVLSY